MNEKDEYELEELIEILKSIKKEGEGTLNFPKAFYCLAKEIKDLRSDHSNLSDTVYEVD